MDTKRLQNYLIDRVLEILHKETLDSYRVRNHNAFTSLVETRDTIVRWNQMKVKTFETVRLLGEECVSLLSKDDTLSFDSYDKENFIQELVDFLKSNAKSPTPIANGRILFCLNKCIEENKNSYLENLLGKILLKMEEGKSVADDDIVPFLGELDGYISAYCVQLIYSGYSKQHLYLQLKQSADASYDEFLKCFKSFASHQLREYVILWKVVIGAAEDAGIENLGFYSNPPIDDILTPGQKMKHKRFLSPVVSQYFFRDQLKSLDIYAAMKDSRENLMKKYDAIHLGKYGCSLKIPSLALVCQKNARNWYITTVPSNYFMDGAFSDDFATSAVCNDSLNKIYSNSSINSGVKDRLRSAIRHLNCGDSDTELEQRFINYWIALEFIFASPHTDENTYTRLKTHLVNVLACSYIRRNVDYLTQNLVEAELMDKGFDLFASAENLDAVAEKAGISLIWHFKLKQMKSKLFTHTDKLKEYYRAHITNIERHLARIYNLRNSLIHEGALKQDVENITSNLRYYLVFMLDQMIAYFERVPESSDNHVVLEDFFNEYISYRRMIEREYELGRILSIPVTRRLW